MATNNKNTNRPANTWDFTINNYTDADKQALEKWSTEVTRGVASFEIGDSGTPHIQGRMTFRRAYRLPGLKKLAPKWHWEPTVCPQDSLYAMKVDTELFWNVDNRRQGRRTDLEKAVAIIKENPKNWRKRVMEEAPTVFVKFHRGLAAAVDVLRSFDDAEEPRDFAPEVHVRWGEPRSGKTRYVFDNHPRDEIWTKPLDWFDGYRGHPVALFDDFYGGVQYSLMLNLLDRYPMLVGVKNAFVQWRPRIIYITSNVPPEEWYPNIVDTRALMERFTTVTKVGDPNYQGHSKKNKM